MTAREFYDILSELHTDRDQELVTVISGEKTGWKLLLTDGKPAAVFAADGSGAADEAAADILTLPQQMLFREKLGHPKHLVVCGAGYVGQGVIRLGRFLGWRVTTIDDRIDFCRLAEKAGADETIADDFTDALGAASISYDPDTYFVVVTRGHRFDRECLL